MVEPGIGPQRFVEAAVFFIQTQGVPEQPLKIIVLIGHGTIIACGKEQSQACPGAGHMTGL